MTNYKLANPLLMHNVPTVLKSVSQLIAATDALDIDLSGVTNIDSAGIACLLELKSIARVKKCQLIFSQTPAVIDKFCQLYLITL